jgi:hypothetical protein
MSYSSVQVYTAQRARRPSQCTGPCSSIHCHSFSLEISGFGRPLFTFGEQTLLCHLTQFLRGIWTMSTSATSLKPLMPVFCMNTNLSMSRFSYKSGVLVSFGLFFLMRILTELARLIRSPISTRRVLYKSWDESLTFTAV